MLALSAMSEKQFQAAVLDLAKRHGWLCFHAFDSRRSQAGFPDLLLLKRRLIVVELKAETGRITRSQEEWLEAFRMCGIEAMIWRPADWPTIRALLGGHER